MIGRRYVSTYCAFHLDFHSNHGHLHQSLPTHRQLLAQILKVN